jgi:glycosyltransferase involved in cell wall biosynthesis
MRWRFAMDLTVAVCTYNGGSRLRRVLLPLMAARGAATEQFEILVVDNASTDDTPSIVESLSASGGLSYARETSLGLSHARNRALHDAVGEIVCFIDDDAVARPTWVEHHRAAYREPNVHAAAGPVRLVWPGRAPAWFSPAFAEYYSGVDYGDRTVLEPPDFPFGTNMSVRRRVALDVGGFNPELGRRGRGLRSFEETEFFMRLARMGGRIAYLPSAEVDHHVSSERMSLRWVLRRAFANGYSATIAERVLGGALPTTNEHVDEPLARGGAVPVAAWYASRAAQRLGLATGRAATWIDGRRP